MESLVFAQLTYRESLRDIEACLRAQSDKPCHLGIRSRVSRSTLADANEARDWRIYADFARRLIGIARKLDVDEPSGVDLRETVYALDATRIDLCLSVCPWAPLRSTKLHDVNILDQLQPEPGAFYVMDRGYLDFETPLRRIRFKDSKTGKRLVFLTNNFLLSALTITELYRCRWQVGVSSQGHVFKSVQVRPGSKDSDLVAWEAPWRESKTVEPSDNML